MINSISANYVAFHQGTNRMQTANQQQHTSFPAIEKKDNSTMQMQSGAIAGGIFRLPGGGTMSAFAFKPENISPDNPIILVKGTDANGKEFEVEVNVNSIDPKSASIVESIALDGYLGATGQPSGLTRQLFISMAMQTSSGGMDAFSKFDFFAVLDELMDAQRFHGNLSGYLQNKELMEILSNFPR